MQEKQTIQRKRHRYWPFYRYDDWGWWHHPYCQPPSLMWMGKPTDEEEEIIKEENNVLDQIIRFARKFKAA